MWKGEDQICVICGTLFNGYGHNAEPIEDGRCCDFCNDTEVVPARLVAALLPPGSPGRPKPVTYKDVQRVRDELRAERRGNTDE